MPNPIVTIEMEDGGIIRLSSIQTGTQQRQEFHLPCKKGFTTV
jgi:hypothetical protein